MAVDGLVRVGRRGDEGAHLEGRAAVDLGVHERHEPGAELVEVLLVEPVLEDLGAQNRAEEKREAGGEGEEGDKKRREKKKSKGVQGRNDVVSESAQIATN